MATNYLNQRRRALRMPIPALAVRSGVPESTVKRVLNGRIDQAAFGTVRAVAEALGVSVQFAADVDAHEYQERQAERKAQYISRLVQGTSALEAQGVSEQAIENMVRSTASELVAGSKRRLWAE